MHQGNVSQNHRHVAWNTIRRYMGPHKRGIAKALTTTVIAAHGDLNRRRTVDRISMTPSARQAARLRCARLDNTTTVPITSLALRAWLCMAAQNFWATMRRRTEVYPRSVTQIG
jgi:hypothetical protein